MNVAAVAVDKVLFRQAVNSLRYTKSYLSSMQPPATSSGVCTSSGSIFLRDELLGRELGCAKQTCIALLMQAESEVIDSLGFLIHVRSVLAGWLGPEAVELEWICAIRWLEQLWAHFSATQERLYEYRLKVFSSAFGLPTLGTLAPRSAIKKSSFNFHRGPTILLVFSNAQPCFLRWPLGPISVRGCWETQYTA